MKEDIKNPFAGLKEIYSHSALVTNDRIDKMMRRIELYCEMCWNDPRREHLLAYFSALKTAFNEIFPIIKDEEEFAKVVNIFPEVYRNIREIENFDEIEEDEWGYSEREHKIQNSKHLISLCLNTLDYIHQVLVGSLQSMGYFFRVDEKTIRGAKARLQLIRERGNLTGDIILPEDEEE